MQKITIIGAGWLGLPLAQHLSQLGYQVRASRTTSEGVAALTTQGIEGFIAQLGSTLSLPATDIMIGCFPPQFKQGQGEFYPHYWRQLSQTAQQIGCKKLIMISTTGVYPQGAGIMREEMASFSLALNNPSFSDKARLLLEAEQEVIDSGIDYLILRFSGLIDQRRHPAQFAHKIKQISHLAPANLLHLTDAISIIHFGLSSLTNEIINVTTPNTVSKAEFYQAALNSIGSSFPLAPSLAIEGKHISCAKLLNAGYSFHFQHSLAILNAINPTNLTPVYDDNGTPMNNDHYHQ